MSWGELGLELKSSLSFRLEAAERAPVAAARKTSAGGFRERQALLPRSLPPPRSLVGLRSKRRGLKVGKEHTERAELAAQERERESAL